MSLVMHAVQQALVTKLTGDAMVMDQVGAVYDTVPQRSPLPYLHIDQLDQEAIPALGERLWRVDVTLAVWTDAEGRKTALMALERLQALLHHGSLNVSGHTVREMRVEQASCALAQQATRVQAVMALMLIVAEN